MRKLLNLPLLIWTLVMFVLAFIVGGMAVYIGLDINKDDEFCQAVTAGARSLVTLGGIPCSLNLADILAHFGKYFLLVYAPLMIPTAIYVGAAGVGAILRRARSVSLSKG